MLMPVEITGEPHAKFPRIEPVVLAPPFQTQTHRRGHQGVRTRLDELFVQRVAEAATFRDGADAVPGGNFFFHPGDELRAGKLLRRGNRAVIALDGRDDVAQIHIQPQLEDVRELVIEGIIRNVTVLPMSMKVLGFVHNQECVPVLPTLANPSWHLTAAPFSDRARLQFQATDQSGCGSALIR
jgi:hypothetical protein